MQSLETIPTSVREHLERAQALATQQNTTPDPQAAVREAVRELARTQPEMCALIMAAQLGHQQVTNVVTEIMTSMERVEQKFLGIPIGEQWVPVTRTRTFTQTLRVS